MYVRKQINVRSYILPLTNIYRTDILSHKLRRLSVKLYTDTIFADDISVRGNKCDHLYADRGLFVHLFLMRSKDGVGDSLDNVVKDIGIIS